MKETAKTSRINIGTASIVLILLILCLAVFSLLSLSDAQASLSFARNRYRHSIRLMLKPRHGPTAYGEWTFLTLWRLALSRRGRKLRHLRMAAP